MSTEPSCNACSPIDLSPCRPIISTQRYLAELFSLEFRALPSWISKQKQKQVCTSHTECVTNLWHLWRSQTVTDLNLWRNLFLCFFFSFFSKTDFVTFWSQMSQMVTLLIVTGTNLFLLLFRLKWFGMREIRKKRDIPESERLCFCFLFGIWLGTALRILSRVRTICRSLKVVLQVESEISFPGAGAPSP